MSTTKVEESFMNLTAYLALNCLLSPSVSGQLYFYNKENRVGQVTFTVKLHIQHHHPGTAAPPQTVPAQCRPPNLPVDN